MPSAFSPSATSPRLTSSVQRHQPATARAAKRTKIQEQCSYLDCDVTGQLPLHCACEAAAFLAAVLALPREPTRWFFWLVLFFTPALGLGLGLGEASGLALGSGLGLGQYQGLPQWSGLAFSRMHFAQPMHMSKIAQTTPSE